MQKFRRENYQRKIEFILDRISNLPATKFDDNYYWDVIFYRIHTSIQALMDIIAMLCKDFGISVKDDYSNIDEIEKKKLFPPNMIEKIRKLNGLRNVLVHRYNHIDNDLINQEKDRISSDIKAIIKHIEAIISEI